MNCEFCQKKYLRAKCLSNHQEKCKAKEAQIVCKLCNKHFNTQKGLTVHTRKHDNTRTDILRNGLPYLGKQCYYTECGELRICTHIIKFEDRLLKRQDVRIQVLREMKKVGMIYHAVTSQLTIDNDIQQYLNNYEEPIDGVLVYPPSITIPKVRKFTANFAKYIKNLGEGSDYEQNISVEIIMQLLVSSRSMGWEYDIPQIIVGNIAEVNCLENRQKFRKQTTMMNKYFKERQERLNNLYSVLREMEKIEYSLPFELNAQLPKSTFFVSTHRSYTYKNFTYQVDDHLAPELQERINRAYLDNSLPEEHQWKYSVIFFAYTVTGSYAHDKHDNCE